MRQDSTSMFVSEIPTCIKNEMAVNSENGVAKCSKFVVKFDTKFMLFG